MDILISAVRDMPPDQVIKVVGMLLVAEAVLAALKVEQRPIKTILKICSNRRFPGRTDPSRQATDSPMMEHLDDLMDKKES